MYVYINIYIYIYDRVDIISIIIKYYGVYKACVTNAISICIALTNFNNQQMYIYIYSIYLFLVS